MIHTIQLHNIIRHTMLDLNNYTTFTEYNTAQKI